MNRPLVITASIIGCLAVIQGAFGAHALREMLAVDNRAAVYHTGVEYQFYHVLATFAAAWVASRGSSALGVAAGWCFVVGIGLFSGSLYVLAISHNASIRQIMGPITPAGGLFFIVGWVVLAIAAARQTR